MKEKWRVQHTPHLVKSDGADLNSCKKVVDL